MVHVLNDSLSLANELRPVLLRLSRLVRRETPRARRHCRAGVAALRDRRHPGHQRPRARRPGADLGTRDVRASRPARGRRPDRAHAQRRPAARRRLALARGRARPRHGAQAAHRLARRAARGAVRATTTPRSRPRSGRSRGSSRTPNDPARPHGRPPHVREPAPPSQLPPLLRGPDHLGVRDVDAERRALLADPEPHALAARRRLPLARTLRAVHDPRPLLRRRRRPLRQPAHGDRDAVGADGLLRRARGGHAARHRAGVGGLRDRRLHRHRGRLRPPRPPELHRPARRPRRAAERDRAQLVALQHGAHPRPGARRRS